jgi:hypothetical protein
MINIDGFSKTSIDLVNEMLYAEGQLNPLEGECGQKEKRKMQSQPRTQEQQKADKTRAQANQGKDSVPSGVRSAAAKKAAETRKRCKGTSPQPPQSPTGVK